MVLMVLSYTCGLELAIVATYVVDQASYIIYIGVLKILCEY